MPQIKSGNPVVSTGLTQYSKGYKSQACRSGYLEGSAVPISRKKVLSAGGSCGAQHAESPSWATTAPLIERDIMLVLLMWETPLRGNDIGKVSCTNFFLHDSQPIQTPTGHLQGLSSTAATGFQLTLRPNGPKQSSVRGQGLSP